MNILIDSSGCITLLLIQKSTSCKDVLVKVVDLLYPYNPYLIFDSSVLVAFLGLQVVLVAFLGLQEVLVVFLETWVVLAALSFVQVELVLFYYIDLVVLLFFLSIFY